MDGGAWWAIVHGVAKSRTRLSDFTFTFHFHALEKEMATHSSVLSRRVPGTGEPVGLLSMGSHRVGHDCRDLVAAAAANPLHVCNPIEFDGSRIWLEMQAQYAQGYLKIPQEWIWLFHHTGRYTFYTVLWCTWLKFVPKWINKLLHVMHGSLESLRSS